MAGFYVPFLLVLAAFCSLQPVFHLVFSKRITETEIRTYRDKVERMFYHAYDNYLLNAYPYDELRPLSCDGVDTWGRSVDQKISVFVWLERTGKVTSVKVTFDKSDLNFSLTLIDALDTLAIMGNFSEFRRVAQLLVERVNFDMNINVSVFETNIRVVGGLLSAHLLSHRVGMNLEPGWPCSGPLLRLAETIARRLLPAFETDTGMPYGTVNLRHGVPIGETTVTCTAGVTTFLVEFGTLSRLTGDPSFEAVALKAMRTMWELRSPIGLVGNHVDVMSGKWTAVDSGIGAGVDSYYEYLVKGAILLQKPELMGMFNEYRKSISRYIMHDDWHMWVNMQKGQVTLPVFQSLEAFWPGLLTLVGDLDSALKSIHNYHQVWKQFGFTPEFYNIPQAEPNNHREGYPLRPELIESIMYVYKATKDPSFLEMGMDIVESIDFSAKTPCGYATIKDVRNHVVEDRMESFFLAETTKYLYLLFDPDNFLHNDGRKGTIVKASHGECVLETGGFVFNTEAHPIDVAAVYCCSAAKEEGAILQNFHDNMDLLALLGLDDGDGLKPFRTSKRRSIKPKRTNMTVSLAEEDEPLVSPLLQSSPNSLPWSDSIVVDSSSSSDGDAVTNLSPIVVQSSLDTDDDKIVSSYSVVEEVNDVEADVTMSFSVSESHPVGPSGDASQTTPSFSQLLSAGTGKVTYLGEVDGESAETKNTKCLDKDNEQEISIEKEATSVSSSFWTGTKPILSNVQRDTLRSSGLLDLSGINLVSVERNSSTIRPYTPLKVGHEVMSCPAQPFLLRLSLMGEMFRVT